MIPKTSPELFSTWKVKETHRHKQNGKGGVRKLKKMKMTVQPGVP